MVRVVRVVGTRKGSVKATVTVLWTLVFQVSRKGKQIRRRKMERWKDGKMADGRWDVRDSGNGCAMIGDK